MPRSNALGCLALALAICHCAAPGGEPGPARLSFVAEGKEFRFDTGLLRGALRRDGKSLGLGPVTDAVSGAPLAGPYGLFSHYRLLDAERRYGDGAWGWASAARLLPDGAVEAVWTADQTHPFDLKAVYRWAAPDTLDVTTTLTARSALSRMEVFLASYFVGFTRSFVYAKDRPEAEGGPGFVEAVRAAGIWQMFPRDAKALSLIGDGRWKHPPSPVDWKLMSHYAGALAMRRSGKTSLTALVMATPGDCFAVATPYGEEGHGSLYLSLLGRDIAAGQSATARSRLIIARDISDDRAIALYHAYVKGIGEEKD